MKIVKKTKLDTGSVIVELENDEWTYDYSDAFKHGQHGPKMHGLVGYVNWHLLTSDDLLWIRDFEKKDV